jgi:hypothetical protein
MQYLVKFNYHISELLYITNATGQVESLVCHPNGTYSRGTLFKCSGRQGVAIDELLVLNARQVMALRVALKMDL